VKKIQISIIGISIQQLEMGAGLSPDVRQAIPSACRILEKKVRLLLAE
jgi:hypothetical protein